MLRRPAFPPTSGVPSCCLDTNWRQTRCCTPFHDVAVVACYCGFGDWTRGAHAYRSVTTASGLHEDIQIRLSASPAGSPTCLRASCATSTRQRGEPWRRLSFQYRTNLKRHWPRAEEVCSSRTSRRHALLSRMCRRPFWHRRFKRSDVPGSVLSRNTSCLMRRGRHHGVTEQGCRNNPEQPRSATGAIPCLSQLPPLERNTRSASPLSL